MTLDLSKVPFLAERQALLPKHEEYARLQKAIDDAREAVAPENDADEDDAVIAATEKSDEFSDAIIAELGNTHPWRVSDDEGVYFELCVLTGLPLRDDDEVLLDEDNTGGHVLRTAVFPEAAEDKAEAA